MRRLPLDTLGLPAAGFALTLGLAIFVSASAGARPAARLHEAASSYLRALYEGDARGAATWRQDGDEGEAARRARALEGALYFIDDLEIGPDGDVGRVQVVFFDAEGRPIEAEEQLWERELGGGWRLGRLAEEPAWHHR